MGDRTGLCKHFTNSRTIHQIFCGYSQASYNLSIRYINGVPQYNVTTSPFTLPASFHPNYKKEPKQNEQDLWDLEVTARGLFHYFQGVWLSGKIQLYDDSPQCNDLRLRSESRLALIPPIEIDDFKISPTGDLTVLLPELFRNFTISTFQLNSSHTNITTCILEETDSVYQYEAVGLVVSYGVATVVSIGCALWGLRSLHVNRKPTKPTFSQFLTTYNLSLEGTIPLQTRNEAFVTEEHSSYHRIWTEEVREDWR